MGFFCHMLSILARHASQQGISVAHDLVPIPGGKAHRQHF